MVDRLIRGVGEELMVGAATISRMSISERVDVWSRELFRALLPVQELRGVPVLLACDDETIRTVAAEMGITSSDPSMLFGHDICTGFAVGRISGWKNVVAGGWERAPRPRPLPAFFPVLCLWVLAASRMAPDKAHPTNEYHGRLCQLLGVSGHGSLPCFNFIGLRFRDLATWLEHDQQGRHGHLIVPPSPRPEHVGYAVEQTVFRLRDRQVLSVFFTERLGASSEGFEPLRLLQRWSGRGQLTGHALRLIEEPAHADRVRAAIQSALRSWDGAELVETTAGALGRLWPARIRLLVHPQPRLQFGAANPSTVLLAIDGLSESLEAGRELDLPWSMLARATGRPVELGDARSAAGGVKLPRLGETLIFENTDDGLLRVEQPVAEKVWVLTHDGGLQERLQGRKFNDRGALPFGWELLYDVPVGDIPGIERATSAMARQTPLRLEGGLTLGHPRYLSGHSPHLLAGDLESDDYLSVSVNGTEVGRVSSGGRINLPAEPGRFDIDVGGGYFKTSYDVEAVGEPARSTLCHDLGSERVLRSGARPVVGDRHSAIVCGACVTPEYSAEIPLLTRVLTDVDTINFDGSLTTHRRPATPVWFSEIGLHERGRWELFCTAPIWLVMPPAGGRARVRLLSPTELTTLDERAVRRVLSLGRDVDVQRGAADQDRTRELWELAVALAESLEDREPKE